MDKQKVIKCCKCTLVLSGQELLNGLNPKILKEALERGKGYNRMISTKKRQTQGFDRWQLYETLKGNRPIDELTIQTIETMSVDELREGLIEYLNKIKRG